MRTRRPADRGKLLNVIAILAAMLVGAMIARAQNSYFAAQDHISSRK